MGSYTKITLQQASSILALYGKAQASEVIPLSLGISNSNYKVLTAVNAWLLKISNDKGLEQLRKEQEILRYLKEQGYPYSLCPEQTLLGENVYLFEQSFGVLFPFIEGIPPGPSDFTCREIGAGLAKLHTLQHSQNVQTLRQHEEVGFGAPEILSFLEHPSCPEDFKEFFSQVFADELNKFVATPFEKGIIHGDLYYDNTLFHHDHLSVVLDFEQAGFGEYILDLGICISGTCLEKGRVIQPLIDSFLLGYESIRPLPEVEKHYINHAVMLGLFSIALWRIKRFTVGNLNPLMSDSYRELLMRALSFKQTLAHQGSKEIL